MLVKEIEKIVSLGSLKPNTNFSIGENYYKTLDVHNDLVRNIGKSTLVVVQALDNYQVTVMEFSTQVKILVEITPFAMVTTGQKFSLNGRKGKRINCNVQWEDQTLGYLSNEYVEILEPCIVVNPKINACGKD